MKKKEQIIQYGKSLTADFETNEWTFRMPEHFEVTSREYVIIMKSDFEGYVELSSDQIKELDVKKINN